MATSLIQQTGEARDRTYNPWSTRKAVIHTTPRRLSFPKVKKPPSPQWLANKYKSLPHQIIEHSINCKKNRVDPDLSASEEAGLSGSTLFAR